MIIAVDFDRTLMDTDNPPTGKRLGPPLPGAVESIQKLHEAGHEIVIHTCRSVDGPRALKIVADWLKYFNIPFDRIWDQPGKVIAAVYIDDLGLHHVSWEQTMAELKERGISVTKLGTGTQKGS